MSSPERRVSEEKKHCRLLISVILLLCSTRDPLTDALDQGMYNYKNVSVIIILFAFQ